jgi:hypothetical protein
MLAETTHLRAKLGKRGRVLRFRLLLYFTAKRRLAERQVRA